MSAGTGISLMAATLAGSGSILLWVSFVPHECDRWGFELKFYLQRAIDRVQHTSPRAAPSFGGGRCQRLHMFRYTHTRKYHRRC